MPQAADILSDPEINQAYEDVRSDKSETTWLVLKASEHAMLDEIAPAAESQKLETQLETNIHHSMHPRHRTI
jgi:hypothetical protein